MLRVLALTGISLVLLATLAGMLSLRLAIKEDQQVIEVKQQQLQDLRENTSRTDIFPQYRQTHNEMTRTQLEKAEKEYLDRWLIVIATVLAILGRGLFPAT